MHNKNYSLQDFLVDTIKIQRELTRAFNSEIWVDAHWKRLKVHKMTDIALDGAIQFVENGNTLPVLTQEWLAKLKQEKQRRIKDDNKRNSSRKINC